MVGTQVRPNTSDVYGRAKYDEVNEHGIDVLLMCVTISSDVDTVSDAVNSKFLDGFLNKAWAAELQTQDK